MVPIASASVWADTLPITHPVLIVAVSAGIFLLAPLLMQSLRLPGLVGLILAGALIGPNGLNILDRSPTIVLLGTVGLLYLMFLAGIQIDLQEFKRYRHHSVIFGAFTFILPQGLGTFAMLALGYDVPTAILIASMFASHTLLAYPIVMRFGIGKQQAVTTTVGGTIITDTAALLVLAIIAASTRGELDSEFWIRLVISLAIYTGLIWYGLPRLTRWFFRSQRSGAVAEFVFVFAILFAGSYLAEVAGVEAIVGAFAVGLALNRLIPEQSLLANRVHFVGEAIFIPFFLLSVGMLVDVRVLAGDPRVWEVMIAMTLMVTTTKWLAAMVSRQVLGYSREEGWMMFGLSVPQAAATLAATIIGREIGLFDDAVLNGTILMILVTCVVGPWVVDRYGRRLALREERSPLRRGSAPQRILVPMANPATAEALLDLALAIREPGSNEPIFPMTVVPDDPDRAQEHIALAEKMLSHAVAYATGLGIAVTPLTRVDHNFANGISRGALETRTSTIIIGWDARRTTRQRIFGTVLDQLLQQTKQHVLVAKLGHPLVATRRVILVIPRGSDRLPGFFEAMRAIKLLASRLGAAIAGYAISGQAELYRQYLTSVRPDVPVQLERLANWDPLPERLRQHARPDDLIVLLSARRGSVSWHPALERLPTVLADLTPETFLVFYAAELDPRRPRDPNTDVLPTALAPENIVIGLPRVPCAEAIERILATAFEGDRDLLATLTASLMKQEQEFTTELQPGVLIPHLRVPGLPRSMVFLGISHPGVDFPNATAPAQLIFIVLTPEHPPEEHLRHLAEVARLLHDPARVAGLREARSFEDVLRLFRSELAAGLPE